MQSFKLLRKSCKKIPEIIFVNLTTFEANKLTFSSKTSQKLRCNLKNIDTTYKLMHESRFVATPLLKGLQMQFFGRKSHHTLCNVSEMTKIRWNCVGATEQVLRVSFLRAALFRRMSTERKNPKFFSLFLKRKTADCSTT